MIKSNDYNLLIQSLAKAKASLAKKGIINAPLEEAWFLAGCLLKEANKREKQND